jgi:hypothetical protein
VLSEEEISKEWETGRAYLNMKNEWPVIAIYRKDVA